MKTANITIERSKLLDLAGNKNSNRFIYIQAPAGYGKTVFSGHWLNARKCPGATLALDDYDNTIYDICGKLKNALEELYPDHQPLYTFTRHPAFDSAPTEFLMRAVAAAPKGSMISIVIDDLHCISAPEVLKFLHALLNRLPVYASVLILSRTAPPELFSDLFLKNNMMLITQEHMRFDSQEIYALYQRNQIDITKKQADTIFRYTEGWPIEINALLISGVNIPSGTMPQGQLQDFLKTQVWDMWDEDARSFMLGTVIEEELTDDICDALLGRTDSKAVLESLLSRGCFLYRQRNGSYRFHKLFQEFLMKRFEELPLAYHQSQYRTSGEFYLTHKDFYRAIERFSYIKDYDHIAQCFDLLEQMDRAGFDTERVMQAVRGNLDEHIAEQYPFLFFMMAFTARNDGRIDDFKRYADLYYANYIRVTERNPELAHNIFFLYIMDFRFTFQDIIKLASAAPGGGDFQGVRGSATAYFPLYHRSFRDFSELVIPGVDLGVAALGQSLGALLGAECDMILDCLRAGLFYERGELLLAQEISLQAAARIRSEFAPESKFCVLILALTIDYALHQDEQAEKMQQEIRNMIEYDKAFYLQPNFEAVMYKNLLSSGDAGAAGVWLRTHDTVLSNHLTFFRLHVNFTTARAHITDGNYDKAIILLLEIYNLCDQMGRCLDVIEAEVLLAIAYWKKKRGHQKTALSYLEDAVRIAQPYEYEQTFINEGIELESMLSRLKSRTIRSDYKGEINGPFVKKLYIAASQQASHGKGLTGGRAESSLKFTQQQKEVMRLMCEGYSYRQIGETLGIQHSTVRSHVELIYKKLDVSGVKEAVIKIHELNVLGDE